jgi:hypothetical protein
MMLYFFFLGLAFLFLEIAFIQKFMLLLHHPVHTAAVVLTAFLLFAGLGSGCSRLLTEYFSPQKVFHISIMVIIFWGIISILTLPPLFALLLAKPFWLRACFSLVSIAPLAFAMGMPFPLALTRLGQATPALIPWAWAINGCASVLSASCATLLAIHYGFTWVIAGGLALYSATAFFFPGPKTD